MPSANFGDSRFRIDYSVSQIQQDIANNRSLIRRVLVMVKQGSSYAYSSAANSWSSSGPSSISGGFTFDFGSYSSLLLMDHYEWVSHNADGTKSFTSYASVSADLPNGWDSASTSQAVYLSTIPRATTPKLPAGVSGLTTGVAQTIELPRASTGFTHDVTWTLGSQSGTVATGAGTSATVTLPHTVMTELPNAVSGNVTFTTVTKSGATVIGTNNTAFPLTAAASVLPTVTSVSWDDQNTTVKTNIGAFVQGLSLVKGTIVAEGIHGSTISSRSVVISGNILPDNTVFQVDGSGTIAASGMATDSRGRTASMAADFTVLPYEAPKIGVDGWSVKRANSSNVADDNGQYLRIDLHAIAKSLMPSTVEKNALHISVRTRPTNGVWTSRNVINPGLTHNTSFQVSGGAAYLVAQSYEVEISLSDNTGISPVVLRTTVGTTIVTIDLRGNQVGIGKMHELGTLDVAGDIYANGKKVLVTGEVAGTDITSGIIPNARIPQATTALRGGVLLATQAEVNAGTDNSKYVSPLTLRNVPAVAFMARLSANFVHTGATQYSAIMPFDFILANSGNAYNPATYTFTAPYDGVYNFTTTLLTSNATTGPIQSIYKNDVLYRQNVSMGYNLSYATFGFDIFITLVAGDTIKLYNTNANITNNTFPFAYANYYCGSYVGKHTV